MKHQFRFLGHRQDSRWQLSPDDVIHFSKVLRLGDGAVIELADGQGRWAIGAAKVVSKSQIFLEDFEEFFQEKTEVPLTLAMGALKPSDFESILAPLVELAVDRIIVFNQQQGDKKRLTPKHLKRWESVILAAFKQCKRAWLPELHIFPGIVPFLAANKASHNYVLDPHGESCQLAMGNGPTTLVLGSEAGLDEVEQAALASADFKPLRIGREVLRARTAAIAAVSILSFLREPSDRASRV